MAEEQELIKEFSPDCYLLDYSQDILKIKSAFNSPIDNLGGVFFTSKHDPNNGFKSSFNDVFVKLAGRDDLKKLGELTSLNIAGLHPKIKLFRLDQDFNGKKVKREFIFNYGFTMLQGSQTAEPIDMVFDNAQYRGGAGIKSVSYALAGTNPVEAERAIDLSITFLFQSVNDFLGPSYNGESGLKKLIDQRKTAGNNSLLFDHTDIGNQTGVKDTGNTFNYLSLIERPSSVPNEYDARNFQILAQIGYYVNTDTDVVPEDVRNKIEKMDLNLMLTLINHELSFTEEGQIELKVNYYGSMQQYMNDPKTDYFSIKYNEYLLTQPNQLSASLADTSQIKTQLDKLTQDIKNGCITNDSDLTSAKDKLKTQLEEYKTKKESQKEMVGDARSFIYSSFISDLYKNSLLYSFKIPKDDLTSWVNYINDPTIATGKPSFPVAPQAFSTTTPNDDFKDKVKEASKEEPDSVQSLIDDKRNTKIKPDEEYLMNYFYFGDLLQSISKVYNMYNTTNRIILGDIDIQDQRNTNQSIKFNLGELPINLELFQAWFLEKVVKPKKTSYRLDQMIRDLVNGLLRPALNTECLFARVENKPDIVVDISMNTFTIQTDSPTEPIQSKQFVSNYGVFNNVSNFSTSIADTPYYFNYLTIYSKQRFCEFKGLSSEDEKRGIMHLYVGKADGPVTSIKFKRIDQPYLKEAKATREGFTPISSLRDIYNADISMIGNHFFYPGMSVYIHPPIAFGNPSDKNGSLANIMGVGGYYNIIRVSTNLDSGGKYETSLDCYWQSSGDGCGDIKKKQCSA